MFTSKSLLELAGFVLMLAAAALLLHDLYRLYAQSELILHNQPRPAAIELRFRVAAGVAVVAVVTELWAILY